jgi:hypothetical protein
LSLFDDGSIRRASAVRYVNAKARRLASCASARLAHSIHLNIAVGSACGSLEAFGIVNIYEELMVSSLTRCRTHGLSPRRHVPLDISQTYRLRAEARWHDGAATPRTWSFP